MVEIHARSRALYSATESVARLQETARQVLSHLEHELRMAGYWGASSDATRLDHMASPDDATPAALADAAGGINACGRNWVLDLSRAVDAHDGYTLACPPYNRRARPDSDVLVVRRAGLPVTDAPDSPRLRIVTRAADGHIAIAPCGNSSDSSCTRIPPLEIPPGAQVHDLLAHAYYISRDSTGRTGLPALRRKRLIGSAAGASMQDEEIAAGIEELQVEVGLPGTRPGSVAFVDPSVLTDTRQAVAVRLWLLIRAEDPEPGFVDVTTREFPYGRRVPPPRDAYRRLLVSTTLHLRNTVR